MRLLYQGQGNIRIVTLEGTVIYIDPCAGIGFDLPADLLLVTHDAREADALGAVQVIHLPELGA